MDNLRVVFMGTPDFAVESLKKLVDSKVQVVGVVTAPDKPAGRGKKLTESAVKKYAVANNIPVLQPEKLKDTGFLGHLKSWQADIQVVVAFRMLPEVVWNMPPKGTINLHASLLPHYRGAAPINHAIINGEEVTGVTTFYIAHDIDTGSIIYQEKVPVEPDQTAGELHDALSHTGAELVLKTVQAIAEGTAPAIPQNENGESRNLKTAPKIFREDCHIDWSLPANKIHNFVRGLSPYPAAWTHLLCPNDKKILLKIYRTSVDQGHTNHPYGTVVSNGKDMLKISAPDGYLHIKEIQQEGKKRLKVEDYLKGINFDLNDCSLE